MKKPFPEMGSAFFRVGKMSLANKAIRFTLMRERRKGRATPGLFAIRCVCFGALRTTR